MLCDRFHRLFNLEGEKSVTVKGIGELRNGAWVWDWDWRGNPRGRSLGELDNLNNLLKGSSPGWNSMDTWSWTMGENGEFSAKSLKQMLNLKILDEDADMDETKWCKYIPNKVSIFMWRLKRGCLPVRALLDRYEIDLDINLCLVCNEVVESLDHCFVSCYKAKSLWNKVFDSWSLDGFDGLSIADILNVDGNDVFPNSLKPI
ncbi:reverse transcriptase domain, reverse transcriptase zinc-binding domain protein [Tanacetum coccineum]